MYSYGGFSSGYGYGNPCCQPVNPCYGGYGGGYGFGSGAAIILVLFILLVIVIGARVIA